VVVAGTSWKSSLRGQKSFGVAWKSSVGGECVCTWAADTSRVRCRVVSVAYLAYLAAVSVVVVWFAAHQ
jgi:hypothetical protein